MHLKSLELSNFRSFSEAEVPFYSDLTILVGENNGGKSNAIDAIRLLTTPLNGRRELYCESTDLRFGGTSRRFALKGTFVELSPTQQGRLLSAAADPSLESAVFGLSYDESNGTFPVQPTIWAGHLKGVPEPGCHQMIRHVYLPPLRDAKRALASGNPTRIHALLHHFLGDEKPEELARRLKRDASHEILNKVDSAVDVGLGALTSGVRRQVAALGFATDEKLIDIARDLRFKLADHGITPEDLRYSGHGYANLLYMATIAVELEKVTTADLTLFLVEEPEAHLHPQLQAAVLCFLEDQVVRSKSANPNYHGPAGELQVVVATHSPNLSAWVAGKKLVVFRTLEEPADPDQPPTPESDEELEAKSPDGPSSQFESDAKAGTAAGELTESRKVPPAEVSPSQPPAAQPLRRSTRCIPLSGLGLDPVAWRKVDRYLDVTKSALLFGGRVLLVEGIAESLLLPVIARKYILKNRPNQLRILRSAVFVPIDGVDFEPYVRLLLTPFSGVRIADRVVVITDGDGGNLDEGQILPGKMRKENLDSIAADLMATDIFDAVTSTYSLETELVRAGNANLLRRVYLSLHPKSEEKWDTAVAKGDNAQALAIQAIFKITRKGDFAQILAERIDQDEAFTAPGYIADAIEALVR
ncbi:MAG TPA: ATP-dependent endonuclease [Acidobacteria bacterium]|nr:ATP-dependent endonuclease [Acidobacteriota bacterium]